MGDLATKLLTYHVTDDKDFMRFRTWHPTVQET